MTLTPPNDGELDALLTYIHERRNFDFRGYKRAGLSRRISARMSALGIEDYQQYMDVLEANPGEFADLFNTILINVTSFLRDREAWESLNSLVLGPLARTKGENEPIRIWSAGCASGEEAYSLAVLLAESLGEDRFRQQVKIYATDADNDALVRARHGRYPERDLDAAFGEQRARRFFESDQGYGVFRPDLRRPLIFGRHDLVQDPPISRIDVLTCRNTLMYFTSEVQRQVLASFHFALNAGGFIFLGKSEALVSRIKLFEPVDSRRHIFRKEGDFAGTPTISVVADNLIATPRRFAPGKLTEAMLEQSPVAQIVVDHSTNVLMANLQGRRLLSMGSSEIGAPLKEAGLSIHPQELRRVVEQVLRERRVLTVSDVTRTGRAGDTVSFELLFVPLEEKSGVAIAFVDVTRFQTLRDFLERSQNELESAYEELQSAVEELETTNEELQSTNEELETTNEELHSTNEELETMNEELQSTNEELETINNELRIRNTEVADLNMFLESILASFRSAVVVLGTEMEVRAWNRQAEDLWGLRSEEVQGQHFLNLDIGFPVESVGHAIRACLAGRSEGDTLTLSAINRRGRSIECFVTISRLVAKNAGRGAILLMDASPVSEAVSEAVSERPGEP
ncbi:MAG: CheR family methyltransferase [Acidimicrobiales bacterium]